ncbi:MAG: hypothetical protein KAV25_04105 [Methanophagales archaeon]|nr:hypothetical protein [Methanophagales archaeon]
MGFPPQGVGAKIEKESKLVPLATIIGALAGILIIIVAAHASFPVYLYYTAVISLLVAIFSLLAHEFLAPPIYDFIKKRREIRKHNALARKYFDTFKDFTDGFGELVEPNRCDNIPYALRDLSSSQEFRNISFLSTQDIHNFFYNFEKRLKRFDGIKEDFSLIVKEFDTIMNMYNKFCICEPIKEIKRIGQDKINEHIKEDYRRHKRAYERFIGNYTDFGKKLNKEFGERIFRDYFEMPEEL